MLYGREAEQDAVGRLLTAARAGRGGATLVRGEAGIGKSALLADAAASASGMRVLRTVGVEAEAELAYATLHQLLRPLLEGVERLPVPQARALRVAFGLELGEVPGQFLVSLGALTLLSEEATRQPLLCVVDDAHSADAPSLAALGFAARRLATEPVALLLAARDGEGSQVDTDGMDELRLGGLPAPAAAALLTRRWDEGVDPVVHRQLLAACAGNPLALIELPGALTREQRAGRAALEDPLPLAGALERAFLRRLDALPDPATRSLLLLAAADGTGRLETIRRAAGRLGLDAALLEADALADLVSVDQVTVRFTHPLIRSAVYQAADPLARRAAHRALAAVLSAEETDRRAWHRARAADGPDEAVAAELEASARRTLRRSGYTAAASALEWAATLSPAEPDRARRLVAAADAAARAGAGARARALLDGAERLGPDDVGVRLDAQYLRGLLELLAGDMTLGARILTGAAAEAARLDRTRVMPLLVAAADAVFNAGQWAQLVEVGQIAARVARDLDGDPGPSALVLRMLAAATNRSAALGSGDADQADEAAAAAAEFAAAERLDDPVLLGFAGELAWGIGDDDLAYRLHTKAVDQAQFLGAVGILAWALEKLCIEETHRGRLAAAEAHALQGRQLAQEAGHVNIACRNAVHLARIAVLRGRAEQAHQLADEVLAEAAQRHLARDAANAHYTLGILALDAGRVTEALWHLEAFRSPSPLPGHWEISALATPELVEAAVRAGQPDRYRDQLHSSLAWALRSRSGAAPALAARCLALTAPPHEADQLFQEALRLHRQAASRPIEHARTQLLYGEYLRRQRHRIQARTHLHAALDVFERLGLPLLAERARAELRAAGATARKRNPSTLDQLTPQELQIAAAVAEGASNREVAARLFITPRTVAHHLHNVFAKLGISSRVELIHLANRHDILNQPSQQQAAGGGGQTGG